MIVVFFLIFKENYALNLFTSLKISFVLVSDYVGGGELFNFLKTYDILPVLLVKIYIAEIAFALGNVCFILSKNLLHVNFTSNTSKSLLSSWRQK